MRTFFDCRNINARTRDEQICVSYKNIFRKLKSSTKSIFFFFLLWRCDPTRVMASSFLRFLDHTQRRTTLGRTPLDEWSARRRDLYLTTHTTHNRQTSMPRVGFEPTISAGERQQTYDLDRAATGTGSTITLCTINHKCEVEWLSRYTGWQRHLIKNRGTI